MPILDRPEMLDRLRQAFNEKRLSLYLGAGVSVGSGLPSWDKLVLAMYFSGIAYSWSNLVQIQCMSSSMGVMIGLLDSHSMIIKK
jgi:hypothetical protein